MKLSYRSVLYSFQKWSICSPQGTRNRIDLLQRWKRRCFEAPHRIFIFISLSRFSWLATAASPVANHTLRFSAPPLDFPGRLSLHRRSYFTTVIHNWSGKYAHLSIYGWTDKIGFLTLFISQKRNWFSASYILGRQTIFDNFLGEYVMRLQRISPLFLMADIDCWQNSSSSLHLFILLSRLKQLIKVLIFLQWAYVQAVTQKKV